MTREHIIGIHTDDTCSSYSDWMPAWLAHLAGLPEIIRVPPKATAITSPLVVKSWKTLLINHPIKQLKVLYQRNLPRFPHWFQISTATFDIGQAKSQLCPQAP